MAYETILCETDGAIATVTINRPKVLNALNPQVIAELGQVFTELGQDDEVKVIILTGAGGKAFVAGADISAMADMNPVQARNFSRSLQEVTCDMEDLGKPIIASVTGFALGGGTEIALACDFIYASESAKFGQPEINLGVVPGAGGTQRLGRVVGKNWARELCYTGDIIDVQLAKEIGLVNRVFPEDELDGAVQKVAKKIASKGRVSMRACKELIHFGADMSLDHGLRLEAEAFSTCFASPDQKEGMTAFLEKRKADFKGEA